MEQGSRTTRLYDLPSRAVEKYLAWLMLRQDRRITKQDAVNELILEGARVILPGDILHELGLEPKNGVREA